MASYKILILTLIFNSSKSEDILPQGLTGAQYLNTFETAWTLDCRTQDCQCYVFPYIPQPYPLNSTGMRQRQLALTGTTNVLRANGVRLINDCQYLDIENEPELYCKAVNYFTDFDKSEDRFIRYYVNCLEMWSKLEEKLQAITTNGVNTLVFYHPTAHLNEIALPDRAAMTLNKHGVLKKLIVRYPPVGQIEALLALCVANKVFRLNLVSNTQTADVYAGLRYQATRTNRDLYAEYLKKLNATFVKALNETRKVPNNKNVSRLDFGLPALTNFSFVRTELMPVSWRDGQSFVDAVARSKSPRPSVQDNTKYPGAWLMLYPWWDTTGGVTLHDDFVRKVRHKNFDGTETYREVPIGFLQVEESSYNLENSSSVVTTNSLMSLLPFYKPNAHPQYKADIYKLLGRKFYLYDVTMSNFKTTENVSQLLRTLPEDQIVVRLIDPMVFPLLRTQVVSTKQSGNRNHWQYFPVEGISAVVTGCDIASFSCHSEVYPLNAADFTNKSKPAFKISKHPAFKKVADFLQRSLANASVVKCKGWCNSTTHIPYVSPVFKMEENCENCIPCPRNHRKNIYRNGICTPCKIGYLRETEVDPDWGLCHAADMLMYNEEGYFFIKGFNLDWLAAFAITFFVSGTFIIAGAAAMKWFDRFEPIMDFFPDMLFWYFFGLLLACLSVVFAKLPINIVTCNFNFIFSTVARTFIPTVHFTRCVQSWIHIHRQNSVKKADYIKELKAKVTITPGEARKLKTCRTPSLFDSMGFRATFIWLIIITVVFYAAALAEFFVFPFVSQMGCERLDAWNHQPMLACYDAEKIGVYLVSLVPMITMLLICIILWRLTAVVNSPPLEPCMIGIAAFMQLMIIIPVVSMMAMVDLNLETFPILSHLLTILSLVIVWLVPIGWKMILCNSKVADKYSNWAYVYSNPPDNVDRIYYSSYPDHTLSRGLGFVLWETFGKDIESTKSNKELALVEESMKTGSSSAFAVTSPTRTGSFQRHSLAGRDFGTDKSIGTTK